MLGHDLGEARHELGQVLRVHRGVLDERDRLGLPARAQEQAQSRLAQLPDRLLLGRVGRDMGGVAEAAAGPAGLEVRHLGLHLLLGVARVLHDEDRGGIALHEAHALGLLDVVAGQVEDHLVGQLDRVGSGLEDRLRGLERLLHVVVVDDVERGRLGLSHQAHLRLHHREEGPLRAHDQAGHVERAVLHQLVQVVAADPPPVPRIPRADLCVVPGADAVDLLVDAAFQTGRAHLGRKLGGGHRPEDGAAAVGQDRLDLDDVLHREPVGDRVRAARVVADHAAEGGPVRRRGIRAEE